MAYRSEDTSSKLILFLIRKKLGVKPYQPFQFDNQKSAVEYYWFSESSIRKMRYDGRIEDSNVSLNWLLNEECKIVILDD